MLGRQRPRAREAHDLLVEGCAEEQRLTGARVGGLVDDPAHVGNEAHVEHAVGFVQYQHLDLLQVDVAPIDEVEQSAGRGDQQVERTGVDLVELLLEVHAAYHAVQADVHVLGQVAGVALDLQRQFPGWCEAQRAWCPPWALGLVGVLPQAGEDRDQERGGLAGAGLGLAGDVVVGEAVRQHAALDRGAELEAQIGDGPKQRLGQHELLEPVPIGDVVGRRDREVIGAVVGQVLEQCRVAGLVIGHV